MWRWRRRLGFCSPQPWNSRDHQWEKQMCSPLRALGRDTAQLTSLSQTRGLQNFDRINSYCCKSLSLWWFVMEVPGSNTHDMNTRWLNGLLVNYTGTGTNTSWDFVLNPARMRGSGMFKGLRLTSVCPALSTTNTFWSFLYSVSYMLRTVDE